MFKKLLGPKHTFKDALIILEQGLRNGEITLDGEVDADRRVGSQHPSQHIDHSRHARASLVRDYLRANPEARTREVVSALAVKGIKVSGGLVYAAKARMKKRERRKVRVVKAAQAATGDNVTDSKADALMMIREVKALAQKAGGYDKLKQLVDALAE